MVYAVDDKATLQQAEGILRYLGAGQSHAATILVANKTDLVRNREVRTAGKFGVPLQSRVSQEKNMELNITSYGNSF